MSASSLLRQATSKVHEEVLDANETYVKSFGAKSALGLPPARKFAILTCMDARLDPANMPGWLKAMRTSSGMLGEGQVMTPSVR